MRKIHLDHRRYLCLAGLLACLLISCNSNQPASVPVEVVTLQNYLRALVDKDEATYTQLVCPSWAPTAFLEFDAYKGVESQMKEPSCRLLSSQDNMSKVNCQGKILQNYGSENQEIDLSPRIYQLISNGENWQVCGFTTNSQSSTITVP